MQKYTIKKGSTSRILMIDIYDSSSAVGARLAGLVYNSANLTAYYNREGAAGAATAITLATATKGTWATEGFIAIDATNMPGHYELHIPNAALLTGANSVLVVLKGATNMVVKTILIELVDNVEADTYAIVNHATYGNSALNTDLDAILDDTGTSGVVLPQAQADKVWLSASRTITAFSTALAVSIWDVLETAIATASSIGLILKTNLDATVSSRLSSAGYTAPDNAGISTILSESQSHPTLAEIEASTILAKETTVSAIKTKTDYLPSATAGAAGGVLIAGSNAATTFATLSVTGATTFTGNVAYQAGITITQSTADGDGVSITGNGSGTGMRVTGGNTGDGIYTKSGASGGGSGIRAEGAGIDPSYGIFATGYRAALYALGSIYGISARADNGGEAGIYAGPMSGATLGNIDGLKIVSLNSGVPIRGNITGNLSGSVGSVTADVGITQAGADKVWNTATRTLTSFGTLIADIWGYSSRTLTAFSTTLAVTIWDVLETAILTASSIGLKVKTNIDAAISSRLASSSYTAPDNASITAIKAKTDTILWADITDIKDANLGKLSINKITNVLTMYKADGVTILKQFNLIDNASVSERVPV